MSAAREILRRRLTTWLHLGAAGEPRASLRFPGPDVGASAQRGWGKQSWSLDPRFSGGSSLGSLGECAATTAAGSAAAGPGGTGLHRRARRSGGKDREGRDESVDAPPFTRWAGNLLSCPPKQFLESRTALAASVLVDRHGFAPRFCAPDLLDLRSHSAPRRWCRGGLRGLS